MRRLIIGLLAVCLAVILSFWIALPVGAQDAAEDEQAAVQDEFTLEEVTVTAQKTEENLQKVSRSMAVISAEDIDIRATESVKQVLQNTAGLSFYSGPYNQIMIRGLGTYNRDVGLEPSVQFNVDGNVNFDFEGRTVTPMLQATNDVERVEVIRGPSGSVNGRSAAAGTINVISKSPDFEKLDGNVSITLGNYDTIRTSAATNFPLKLTGLDLPSFLENLSLRVAVAEDKHEGYVHNEAGEPTGGMQKTLSQRYRIKWQPFEPLTINLLYTIMADASNLGMMVPAINVDTVPTIRTSATKAHPQDPWLGRLNATTYGNTEAQNKQYTESVEIAYETGIGTFNGRFGYSWVPVQCNPGDTNCYAGRMGVKDYELRLNSPEDSRIKWNVGGYLFHKKEFTGPEAMLGRVNPDRNVNFGNIYGTQWGTSGEFDPSLPGLESYINDTSLPFITAYAGNRDPANYSYAVFFESAGATRPIDSWSAFANATIPLFEDKHRLVVGLRKNFEDKRRMVSVGVWGYDENDENNGLPHFTFVYNTVGDTSRGSYICDNCYLVDAEDPVEYKTKEDPLNWTLGWEYDWRDEVMFYVSANNGFKAGGYSPLATPNQYYEDETVINYALGMKSRWFDQRLQLNVEAFYMDYDNKQINLGTNEGPITYTVNGVTYTQPYISFSQQTYNFDPMGIPGVDIDYDWLITPVDRLKGNMEFKHGRYSAVYADLGTGDFPPGAPRYPDYDGRPMANSPDFTFYGSYTHMFHLGNFSVTPQFDGKYSSKYFLFTEYWWASVNPETWQEAYWKFDAYLNMGPQDGTWNLGLYCKNVFEEVVRTMSFFDGVGIDEPRTYGASFKIRF